VTDGLALVVLPELVPGRSPAAYWLTGLTVALVFLGSLLVHELAHALVARRFRPAGAADHPVDAGTGQSSRWGGTDATGGLARRSGRPLTSLAVALVSGTAAILGQAVGAPDLAVVSLAWLTVMNALLAVFNLLPGGALGRWARGACAVAQVR